MTRSWLSALDAGDRYKVLGQSVPCASNFAYLRNHEPTRGVGRAIPLRHCHPRPRQLAQIATSPQLFHNYKQSILDAGARLGKAVSIHELQLQAYDTNTEDQYDDPDVTPLLTPMPVPTTTTRTINQTSQAGARLAQTYSPVLHGYLGTSHPPPKCQA